MDAACRVGVALAAPSRAGSRRSATPTTASINALAETVKGYLGDQPPAEFEKALHAAHQTDQAPVEIQ
jgi:hypothetical protein